MQANGAGTEKVTIISVDTHASPPLEVLRQYCSKKYLDEFDAYQSSYVPSLNGLDPMALFSDTYLQELGAQFERPLMHYDPLERLGDMDADGIAGEVVYHGALNGQPIPFAGFGGVPVDLPTGSLASELSIEGFRIFHRWMADYCAAAPERRRGLIHLPFWDLDASIDIVKEGHTLGLGGVNLPSLRPGILGYHNLHWEPLWETCESLNLSLNLHSGFASLPTPQLVGEFSGPIAGHEILYWTRRALFFLILGGVFDRHPKLKFVLVEQPSGWVVPALAELDDAVSGPIFRHPDLKKRPSEYFYSNCYFGASFMSRGDVAAALRGGMGDRIMWGADYPHLEGTFPDSVLSLRYALDGVDSDDFIRGVVGYNAAAVYGFDMEALQSVADRIGPTLEELHTPVSPEMVPTGTATAGFREGQGWTTS